jgi:FAD/FMN-containing dehydrogenase
VAQAGEAAQRCDERLRARWPQATILVYGHLGDGNLHVVVQEPDWTKETIAEVKKVVYELTGEMGGSVSAEHGIGEEKLTLLALSRSPAELAAMKAIKLALDPFNLLNPGKVIAM